MKKIITAFLITVFVCGISSAEMEILYQKAKTFQKEGQYADAVKIYKNYIEKFPGSKEASIAQYNIGVCFLKLKKNDEAAAEFAGVVNRYPESGKAVDAYLQIGAILMKQKKYNDALKNYRIVIDKYSDSSKAADAQYAIASYYEKISDKDSAKKEYQKVIDNYPDSKKSDKAREKIAVFNGQKVVKKPRRSPRIKKTGMDETEIPARAVRKSTVSSEDIPAKYEE